MSELYHLKAKAEIKCVTQLDYFGMKKPRIGNGLGVTRSANRLIANLKELGFDFSKDPGSEGTDESSSVPVADVEKTTVSWTVDCNYESAVRFLAEVDQVKDTPGFIDKANKYINKKAEVDSQLPSGNLEGAGLLRRYNLLKPYTFRYYSYQYHVKIVDEDGRTIKSSLSKLHRSTQRPIKENVEKKLAKFDQSNTFLGRSFKKRATTEGNSESSGSENEENGTTLEPEI